MTFVTTRGCLFQWRHVMFKLMLSDYNATRWTTCYHRYHCAQWITQYKINPFIVFNSIAMSIAYKYKLMISIPYIFGFSVVSDRIPTN